MIVTTGNDVAGHAVQAYMGVVRRLLDALPEGKALHEKYEERMRLNDRYTQQ